MISLYVILFFTTTIAYSQGSLSHSIQDVVTENSTVNSIENNLELFFYNGEFYKGLVNDGNAVSYNFERDDHNSSTTTYKVILSSFIGAIDISDVYTMNWDSAGSSMIHSSLELEEINYVVVRETNNNASFPTIFRVYMINPIKFKIDITECVNNHLKMTVTSTLKNNAPLSDTSSLKILHHTCSFPLIQHMVIIKSDCNVTYDLDYPVLITYGNLISNVNSQLFSIHCFRDTTDIHLSNTIGNVQNEVVEVQNVFDSAFLTAMRIVDPNTNDPLTSATLGDEISLVISLEDNFVSDFDMKVKTCFVDGTIVYDNGIVIDKKFSDFVTNPHGTATSTFKLFTGRGNLLDEDSISFMCTVDICADTCDEGGEGEGGGYRRKRSLMRRRNGFRDREKIINFESIKLNKSIMGLLE